MRRLTLLTTLTLICGWQGWLAHSWHAAAALAQDAGATQPLSQQQAAATDAKPQADVPTGAQLRASVHRAMVELIEARAAEKPDQEKIQKQVERLQELRRELRAQAGTVGSGVPACGWAGAWQCPWGGPGMGFGRGRRGGPGMMGPGGGPRAERGPGAVQGPRPGAAAAVRPGRGPGRGQGLGAGWGRGVGRGPGYGPGPGRGPGYGRGYGRGWGAFIDEDGDGVCDNYERLWGTP
jgi:hypothetical protein